MDGNRCPATKIYSGILAATKSVTNLYSLKLLRLSNEKTTKIADNPLIYNTAEFPDTRVAAMGHFSLFYKITNNAIIITAFWDNRQDPKELLKLLRQPKI